MDRDVCRTRCLACICLVIIASCVGLRDEFTFKTHDVDLNSKCQDAELFHASNNHANPALVSSLCFLLNPPLVHLVQAA